MARKNSTDSEKIQLKKLSKRINNENNTQNTQQRRPNREMRFENCEIDKTRFYHHNNNDLRLIESVYNLSDNHAVSVCGLFLQIRHI